MVTAFPVRQPELVLIGASTGGPQALVKLLAELPSSSPAIVIHSAHVAEVHSAVCRTLGGGFWLAIGTVEDLAPVEPGHIYLAYGDYHIGVEEHGGRMVVRTSLAAPFNGHRPSVDYSSTRFWAFALR